MGAISVLLMMAGFIVKLHIKVILLLVRRFDITNGLIVGFMIEMLTEKIPINIWIKVVGIAIIVVGSILLQHFFKPARIVFGIISSLFGGLIAYGVAKEFHARIPYIPMVITAVLIGGLNAVSWMGIGLGKETTDKDI